MRKVVQNIDRLATGDADSKPRIRNLFIFGLSVAVLLILWFRFEQSQVTKFALSHLHSDAAMPQSDGTYPCVLASVSEDAVAAVLDRCSVPVAPAGSLDRFEVDLRNSAFVLEQTDLQVTDGDFDVPLTRAYNSVDWLSPNHVHAFGRNSNHSFDIALLGTRNPYTEMMLALGNGDFLYFQRISAGTGYADAVYQHTETSTRFYKATINWNGNGWTLKLTDGSEMSFPESYNAKSLAQGAVTEIRTASGSRLQLQRSSNGDLQAIQTPHGHWIRFSYDDQSRITKTEDDKGNWTRYGYGADRHGMLLYMIQSSGKKRYYGYQNALMTTITNERGHVLVRNTYNSGVLVRQEYENGDVYEYRYIWNTRRTYADKVIVTVPGHSQKEVPASESVSSYFKR